MSRSRDPDLVPRRTAVERALTLRTTALERASSTVVPLDAIDGRTLVEPVVADSDLPARSQATMDGFAVDADAEYPLRVRGETFPEDDPPPLGEGEATSIATGAPLPDGATAVLRREDATVEDGRLRGPPIEPGTNVYERGSNVEAGETLFEAGDRLDPRHAALLRDVGIEDVAVHRRFSTGVLATGTEIHEGRSPDRDSELLAGLVRGWGHEAALEGSVPDEYERVERRIDELATDHDVLLTSGGTGMGRKDYVVRALETLGEVRVRGVRLRCGKPVAAADLPDHDAVAVALPGKPIGAHTAALAVARPLFTGERSLPTVPATLVADVDIPSGDFEYWAPVVLERSEDGDGSGGDTPAGDPDDAAGFEAVPIGHRDSPCDAGGPPFDPRIVSSATRATSADGALVTETSRSAGERVDIVPYAALG